MGKKESKTKLTGPWRNIHGAVWLIGLAILALKGWWWPGILVLVAISMIIEAAIKRYAPSAYVEDPDSNDISSGSQPATLPTAAGTIPQRRLELLPRTCPGCGGPIRGSDVKWTGDQSADCPFCGVNLPMKQDR